MKTRIKCYLTSLVTLLALTGCGDNGSSVNTSNSSSSSNLISSTTSSLTLYLAFALLLPADFVQQLSVWLEM